MMGRANYIQTNFSAGEFSPQLEGRVDIAKYFNGTKLFENEIVKSYGGGIRRPGTYYVAEVKDSTLATRLVSFEFSTTQAYIIEFGDQYCRFYKDGGQIQSGGVAYERATPYLEADLFELQFAQSADVLYIVHPSYAPRKLTRTAHDSWTLTTITFTWGPFLPENTTATTITPGGIAGSIDLVASADVFDSGHVGALFKIGTGYVTITAVTDAQNAVASVEVAVTAAAHTDWSEGAWSDYRGFPATVSFFEQRLCFAGSTYVPQGIWMSQTEDFENMEVGTGDSDAIVYVLSDNQVNAISWILSVESLAVGTRGGLFMISTGDDSPVAPTNVSIRRKLSYKCAPVSPMRIGNYIYYLQNNYRTLREFFYDYMDKSLSDRDVTILSDHITHSRIVEMAYQESPDSILWCVRNDGEMAIMTRQIDQDILAWARVTTDGDFESVAVIPNGEEDQVWVVVERVIGGSTKKYVEYFKPFDFGDEQEDCYFVDCGLTLDSPITITGATQADPVVITTSGAHSLVTGDIVSIRNIVGMTELNGKKFKVANEAATTFELTDLDGNDIDGITYTAYASAGEARKCVASVSGLGHLEGETVSVAADGGAHADVVVAAGAVTLDNYYGEVHVGLKYISKIQNLRFEGASATGSAQTLIKRIEKATVRLYRSLGCKVGTPENQDTVSFRTSSMPMNAPPPLFTGDKEVLFPDGYSKEGYFYIEQDQPLPLTVLCVILRISVQET